LAAGIVAAFGCWPWFESARAQGKLDAQYTVTLAGLPLGRGAWVIEIGDDQFSAAASGMTSGLVRVFAPGQGSSAASGFITANQLRPASYASTISTGKKSDEVRMSLDAGNVKDFDVNPPNPPAADRVPLTDEHRRGVLDPMTASLLRVPGNGELLSPDVCPQHRLSIFDGRLRYDLSFAFKRIESVKTPKGYEGPAMVCAVYFSPVAGHIPDRPAIKYLTKQRDMEVWLVPIAGTRVLVPFRFSVPTPLGTGVLEATRFVSVPGPTKASVRTQ
jgi:hypothetical protein